MIPPKPWSKKTLEERAKHACRTVEEQRIVEEALANWASTYTPKPDPSNEGR